jgi:hypothetical protein
MLSAFEFSDSNYMTVEFCIDICDIRNKKIAGLENGKDCCDVNFSTLPAGGFLVLITHLGFQIVVMRSISGQRQLRSRIAIPSAPAVLTTMAAVIVLTFIIMMV